MCWKEPQHEKENEKDDENVEKDYIKRSMRGNNEDRNGKPEIKQGNDKNICSFSMCYRADH